MTSLQWSAWEASYGMADGQSSLEKKLERLNIGTITEEKGVKSLSGMLRLQPAPPILSVVPVTDTQKIASFGLCPALHSYELDDFAVVCTRQ